MEVALPDEGELNATPPSVFVLVEETELAGVVESLDVVGDVVTVELPPPSVTGVDNAEPVLFVGDVIPLLEPLPSVTGLDNAELEPEGVVEKPDDEEPEVDVVADGDEVELDEGEVCEGGVEEPGVVAGGLDCVGLSQLGESGAFFRSPSAGASGSAFFLLFDFLDLDLLFLVESESALASSEGFASCFGC